MHCRMIQVIVFIEFVTQTTIFNLRLNDPSFSCFNPNKSSSYILLCLQSYNFETCKSKEYRKFQNIVYCVRARTSSIMHNQFDLHNLTIKQLSYCLVVKTNRHGVRKQKNCHYASETGGLFNCFSHNAFCHVNTRKSYLKFCPILQRKKKLCQISFLLCTLFLS